MSYAQPFYQQPPPYSEYQENPGTVLGILAFVFSLVLWPVGLILSLMSRTQSRHAGRRMTGLAQAALILSLVAAFFSLLLLSGLLFWHLSGPTMTVDSDVTIVETIHEPPMTPEAAGDQTAIANAPGWLSATGEPVALTDAPAVPAVVDATRAMGLTMLADEGNAVVSPSSLAVALSMLSEGARGETLADLENAIGAQGAARQEALAALRTALAPLAGDPAVVQDEDLPDQPVVHLGTQMVVDQRLQPNQAFVQTLQDDYGAGFVSADFGAPDAKETYLDPWVRVNSGGLIQQSAIEPTNDTRLVLQDAIVLAARWESEFDEGDTADGEFALLDGTSVEVPTMMQVIDAPYAEVDGWRAVRMFYTGHVLYADLLLPPAGVDPASATPELLARIDEGLSADDYRPIALYVPKLNLRPETLDLRPVITDLGAGIVFTDRADLTGIGSDPSGLGLVVGKAAQQAVFQLDEGGTRAAAVTEIEVVLESAPFAPEDPIELRFDRPFLVQVADTETSWPLFMAAVRDPR